MTDRIHDDVLRAAGRRSREEIEAEDRSRFGDRWDEYCAGRLRPPEESALLDESADPLAATLFEPLGDEFKASLVRELRREKPTGKAQRTEGLGSAGRLRDWRRLLKGLLGGGQFLSLRLAAAAVVVAAAVVLYPMVRSHDGPLPRFELELLGARAERSGGEPEALAFAQGGRFNFRLQPRERVESAPALRVYVRREGGELERWKAAEAAAEVSGDGVVLARDLVWTWGPGRFALFFAIGRSMPSEDELRRRLGPGPDPRPKGWQLLQREIRVED